MLATYAHYCKRSMISVRSARNSAIYTPAGTHSPENIGTERVDAILG